MKIDIKRNAIKFAVNSFNDSDNYDIKNHLLSIIQKQKETKAFLSSNS